MRYTLRTVICDIVLLSIGLLTYGQMDTTIYYLNESFETTPRNWQSLPADDIVKWTYQKGGHNGNPVSSFQGNYNAYFYWNDFETKVRDLVSYPINLSHAVKPRLTFYHTQAQSSDGTDNLMVLFRTSPTAKWDTIATYPTAISSWKNRSFYIDEVDSKYLTNQFYLAFRGLANGGHGICIDSVRIVETAVIDRYVSSVNVNDVTYPVTPSGVRALPVFKIDIVVEGNTGTIALDSIKIKSLSTDNSVFDNNGFQLFYTNSDIFKSKNKGVSTQIGSSVSISNGYIKFKGLSKTLKTGSNILWMTVDVKSGEIHSKDIDFSLEENNLYVSGHSYPSLTASGSGKNTIEESILYDNFYTDKGWSIQGDFERDAPKGKFVTISNDPDVAFSGTNVLGTDLNTDGAYMLNIDSANAYFATTPLLNMKYFDRIKLSMMKWIAFEQQDKATIDVSIDGGTTWQTIWNSQVSGQHPEYAWNSLYFYNEVNSIVRRQQNVRFRFSIKFSDNNNAYAGWNIDNFAVTGEYITNDVGITQMILPCSDCINAGHDSVEVVIRNYAAVPSQVNLPLFFSLNGKQGPKVYDTLKTSIPVDGSVVFRFKLPANFPSPGNYNFLVATDRSGDQDRTNDSVYTTLKIQDNINPPKLVNFETGEGYWYTGGKVNSWICKVPDASIGSVPGSPTAWVLSPYGNYSDNDSSYVISSCYNFNASDRLILRMKYNISSQANHDGVDIQYTTNDGATWTALENNPYGYNWNWYTTNVSALGKNGWSGNSGGWTSAKTILPASLLSKPKVKFSVLWESDGDASESGRGFTFDDFEIFPAPPDVGVSAINSPVSACNGVNTGTISITVKNYGLNSIKANDTIPVGYQLDNNSVIYENFITPAPILPGATTTYSFSQKVNLSASKLYSISAFTLLEDDPWFYSDNNDTSVTTFNVWPNPRIVLPDTIGSRQPDTLMIKPQYPDWVAGYSYLWQDNVTTDSVFDVAVEGLHWVRAIEPVHGCQTTDSVHVVLLYFDAGATEIVSPVSSCELTGSEIIQVRVANVGTDSIIAGDKIAVSYSVNGSPPVQDTLTITHTLRFSNSIVYSFISDPYNFSPTGTYTINASASYVGGDKNVSNDAISKAVDVYGYTPLELGPDKVVKALNYTIDAGPAFVSYIWNTGDASRTTTVDEPGKYWVDAIDSHGCPSNDTVDIWLKIRDIQANMLVNPVTTCDRSGLEEISVRIVNTGTDTILTTDNLTVKYKVNGGSEVSETFHPVYSIYPYAQYTHDFASSIDISNFQSYTFDVVAAGDGDLRQSNDSLSITIQTNQNPEVYLGEDQTTSNSQLILDAGAGTNYSYLWQDGTTTTQTFIAKITSSYWCTVTNSETGCYGIDTINLVFDINDYALQSVSVPNQVCQGNRNNVSVSVLNNGSFPRTGVTLNIAFKIGTSDPVVEQFTVSSLWLNSTSKTLIFTHPFSFVNSGTNALSVYFYNHTDNNSGNDVINRSISVLESPEVDFGGDTLKVSFPYQLDAGNHESYQWQDNTTNRYLTVTTPGKYSVTVTNAANCITTQSVYIEAGSFVNEAAADRLDVKLYPNPASEILNIEANIKSGEEVTIELVDITNHVVFFDQHSGYETYYHQIDVNSLARGVYFLRFRNSEIYQVSKIIVQ